MKRPCPKKPEAKTGFYLLEALIYITLSCIFFIMLFNFASSMYTRYKTFSLNLNTQSWSVIDLIARDLQKTNQIITLEKNIIIFSTSNKDICWQLTKNNLYRIEGKYNKENKNWLESVNSLVSYNVISFESSRESQIISLSLELKQAKFKKDIFIRKKEYE